MGAPRPRPTLYPHQLVVQIDDELKARLAADAAARPDQSKAAATRRLLRLGMLLDDALDAGTRDEYGDVVVRASAAKAVA